MTFRPNYSQVLRRLNRNQRIVDREVMSIYRQTLGEIRQEIARIYEKHAVGGRITQAEIGKYNRLTNLEKDINKIVGHGTQRARATIEAATRKTFVQSADLYAQAIEQAAGRQLPFGRINPRMVRAATDNPLEKIAMDRLRNLSQERIRRAIAQGIIRGDDFTRMAREIRSAINGNASDALRIARTEGHRAQIEGHLHRTNELIEKGATITKVWVSAEDDRTREDHRIMNEVEAKDGIFRLPDGATAEAPGLTGEAHHDINCRCTYEEIIEL